MIVTELYNGQGLGNQLWCYVVARCIALQNGYDFGIQSPHKYKGSEFLEVDMGLPVIGGHGPEGGPPVSLPNDIEHYYKERGHSHPRTRVYIGKKDEGLLSISDNTKIDGVMQSIDYIYPFRETIKKWLKINPNRNITKLSDDDVCIIHIRGGDFLGSSAFLQNDYYVRSINKMLLKNSNMQFYIVTDDVRYATRICPGIPIIGGSATSSQDSLKAGHHIGGPIWMDWSILYNARNAIISASSFSFWPIWLNDNVDVIAPMYWGDYKASDGYWSCGDSLIPGWTYLHRDGSFYPHEECLKQKKTYETKYAEYWK